MGGVGVVRDRQPLYVASDNIIAIGPVTDRLGILTAAQIQAATGTVTVYDSNDVAVPGATGLALSRFSGSANRFYAAIDNTVTIVDAANYYAIVIITAGGITLAVKELLVGAYQT